MDADSRPEVLLPQEICDIIAEHVLPEDTIVKVVRRKENNGGFTLHPTNLADLKGLRTMLVIKPFHAAALERLSVIVLELDVSNLEHIERLPPAISPTLLAHVRRLEIRETQSVHVQPHVPFSVWGVSPGPNNGLYNRHLYQIRASFEVTSPIAALQSCGSTGISPSLRLISVKVRSMRNCCISNHPGIGRYHDETMTFLRDIQASYLTTIFGELPILSPGTSIAGANPITFGGNMRTIVNAYGEAGRKRDMTSHGNGGFAYEASENMIDEDYKRSMEKGGQWEVDAQMHGPGAW